MNIAVSIMERSKCTRKHVGCVIASDDFRHISFGYNGGAAGIEDECNGIQGICCTHAEANCLVNMTIPRTVNKLVFVTTAPCVLCSKLLINSGNIKKVYYLSTYRSEAGLQLLKKANIEIIHWSNNE
jgi:dCMP deaminase